VDRGDHGGMEFRGKMGACSKDGVQLRFLLTVSFQQYYEHMKFEIKRNRPIAYTGWSKIVRRAGHFLPLTSRSLERFLKSFNC